MNKCHQCYNMKRKGEGAQGWCFYKKVKPSYRCDIFHPLSAVDADVIKIDRGRDMQERLQKIWSGLGCEVVDRLGVSRHIVKNGVTLVSGGYQNELQYLRVKHPEVLNG